MAPDLGFVAHATEGDALELAPQRPRDRPAERRLARAGGAHEAQDGTLQVALEREHRDVLDDPVLHLVQTVVILVEDLPGLVHVEPVLRRLRPRQLDHPLQVAADHSVLRRRRGHLGKPLELADRLIVGLLGHARGLDALAQPLGLGLRVLRLPELLANGLELLPQHVVALGPADVALDLLADLALHLHGVVLASDLALHLLEPLGHVELLEELLLAVQVEVEIGAHQVRELRGIVHALGEHLQLVGEPGALGNQGPEQLHDVAHQGSRLHGFEIAPFLQPVDAAAQEGRLRHELVDANARHALHEQAVRVVGKLEHLRDAHHRPDAMEIVRFRTVLDRSAHRRAHQQSLAGAQHVIDQLPGTIRVHQQGREQEGEQDGVLERQHGQHVRQLDEARLLALAGRDDDLRATARVGLGLDLVLLFAHLVRFVPECRQGPDRRCACARLPLRRLLIALDLHLATNRLPLRQVDGQYTVCEVGGHPIPLVGHRYAHPTLEGARGDLHLVKSNDARRIVGRPHAADAQHVVVHADANVPTGHPRELDPDHDVALRLEDVDVGLPAVPAQPVGKLAVELREGIVAFRVAQRDRSRGRYELPFSSVYSASTTSSSPPALAAGSGSPGAPAASPPGASAL
jgi:hypothetical protein